jgi:protein HOOK3
MANRVESDIAEETKNETLQAEHDRMLALQQKTNQKIRELELAHDETRGLLLRALLQKGDLSPELLQIKKEEMLRQIREQIQGVIAAPEEVQPKKLDTTSSEIAESVLQAEAALDIAKKVSSQQFPLTQDPSIPGVPEFSWSLGCKIGNTAKSTFYASESASTLVSTPHKRGEKSGALKKSASEVSASTSSIRKRIWSGFVSSKRSASTITSALAQPGSRLASCPVHGSVEEYTFRATTYARSSPSLLHSSNRTLLLTCYQDIEDLRSSNDELREQLDKTKKNNEEKGSVSLTHLTCSTNPLYTSAIYKG